MRTDLMLSFTRLALHSAPRAIASVNHLLSPDHEEIKQYLLKYSTDGVFSPSTPMFILRDSRGYISHLSPRTFKFKCGAHDFGSLPQLLTIPPVPFHRSAHVPQPEQENHWRLS